MTRFELVKFTLAVHDCSNDIGHHYHDYRGNGDDDKAQEGYIYEINGQNDKEG
jgi:hypothetical protein